MRRLERLLSRISLMAALPLGLAAPALLAQGPDDSAAAAAAADERVSYSFLRTLEGSATVAPAGQGVGEALESNQPLLTGDQVRVGPRSRVEIALADRNRVHLDADSIVILEHLAFSGDTAERVTVLRLEAGELLIEVAEEALGDELPHIVTGNATVYFQQPGLYRIEADGDSWTRVITRRGFAEIVTERGSSIVREDESIIASGERATKLELDAAEGADGLERWSEVLADRAARATSSSRYVEPQLAYEAAPLDDAGDWVEVESVRYWRPHVEAGWRPYWQGRWAWTPSGYTWVSYEPWGWVPYHYGRWCSLPGYGWAWRPGALYSPAWVYWNWTNDWASWVPIGYYTQFYDPWYHSGFRFGVYGWTGGGWGNYSDWSFAPVHCFRDRNFHGQFRTGRDRQRDSRGTEPPRGLLTTDTRDFRPDRIDRTEDLLHKIRLKNQPPNGGDLPDVTDFVGRKGRLPDNVARVVVPTDDRTTGKGRSKIRDIPDVRLGRIDGGPSKVAETPVWRQREGSGQTTGRGLPDGKLAPIDSTANRGKMNVAPTRPAETVKSVPSYPRYVPSTGVRGNETKPEAPVREPYNPGTKGSGGSTPSSVAQDQQRWKEKGGDSEPVQRVVGSVRRPAPGTESLPPKSSPPKPSEVDRSWRTTSGNPAPPTDKSAGAPRSPSSYERPPAPQRPTAAPSPGYERKPVDRPQYAPKSVPADRPQYAPKSTPSTGSSAPRYVPRDSGGSRSASPPPSPSVRSAPPPSSGSRSSGGGAPSGGSGGRTSSPSKSSSSSSSSSGSKSSTHSESKPSKPPKM